MKKLILYFAAALALLGGSASAATLKQQEWLRSLPILMAFDDSARTEVWRVIDHAPKNQTLWFVIHHEGAESYRSKALRLAIEMNCADAKKRCEIRSLPYIHPVLRVASAINIFDVSQATIESYERDPNRVPPNWPASSQQVAPDWLQSLPTVLANDVLAQDKVRHAIDTAGTAGKPLLFVVHSNATTWLIDHLQADYGMWCAERSVQCTWRVVRLSPTGPHPVAGAINIIDASDQTADFKTPDWAKK